MSSPRDRRAVASVRYREAPHDPSGTFIINTLSFEETIKSGNICVFDSTISSAFWQCVHNQNPIILIRHFNVDDSSMFLSRLQKRCEIIDINNPSETVEILKSLNFKKISENSIEKSKTYYDTFENIIY